MDTLYLSTWTDIKQLKSTSAYAVIKAIKYIFSTHGIPSEYAFWFRKIWSKQIKSNGLAEKGVGIAKKLL